MSTQDNIDFLKEEIELLTDALDHIAKVSAASRTSTRRLRWIEQRARWAIAGKPYDNKAFDLPRTNSDATVAKLQRHIWRLENNKNG